VLRFIPPVLLCAVAIVQIALAHTVALTPWKGGGFGMFSTLDHSGYRGVDVIVEGPDRSEQLTIPESLDVAAARAAACPTNGLLRGLAEGVVARERRYDRSVTRVRLRMWRAEFDPATLRVSERTLRTFVYDVH
jgi:hypothetical protein